MGDIGHLRSATYRPAACEQKQEHATLSANRSRSAFGRLDPISALEILDWEEDLDNLDDQEDVSSTDEEVFGEDIKNIFQDATPLVLKQDKEDDGDGGEGNDIWPPSIPGNSLQIHNASPWSNNFWSTFPDVPSADATSPIPLPAPNDLTSTYLPFSSNLALTNHFTRSTINSFQTLHTPIFLHSVLQLPGTLAQILSLRTSDLISRLTSAILLNHTTTLDATTLLPSLVPSTTFSTHHHVNGMLYFPQDPEALEKINDFLTTTHNTKSETRKVKTQIQDSERKSHEIGAWAWVAMSTKGAEEWWALEDFVAGRIVGLETVEW